MVNFLMSGRGRSRNTNEQSKRIADEKAAAEQAAAENNEEHIKIEPVE